MSARLYTISLSHPGMASRLALERKGIEHKVVNLLPGMHPLAVRALGFRASTVPALKIDSVRVQGSLAIVRHLEATQPEPPLYPNDSEARTAVEDAELWGEAVLQPLPRRIFRFIATRSQTVRVWMSGDVVGMPLPSVMAAANKPVAGLMGRLVGATTERVQADVETLPQTLDHIDALIAAGTIGGTEPNAADLQILTSIRTLESFADLAPLVRGRPAALAAARIVPSMPGPVPPALPKSWLDRAQAST